MVCDMPDRGLKRMGGLVVLAKGAKRKRKKLMCTRKPATLISLEVMEVRMAQTTNEISE